MTNNKLAVDAMEQKEHAIDESESEELVSHGNIETAGLVMYLVAAFGGVLLLYSVWRLVDVFPVS